MNDYVELSVTETIWNKENITERDIKRKKSGEQTLSETAFPRVSHSLSAICGRNRMCRWAITT